MRRKLFMLMGLLLLSVSGALAQTAVTGTVVSEEDGQPVIGATVKVSGTNVAAVTDANGRFSISVPDGKRLTV
ncbi:MAG: carboxypeptidase-like regulatory domain-containing protein, partial [Prevotella sp.]|nr:carboxypeptidase-like regulatory domain-containing protein [Prevotella sp.]